MGTRLRDVPPYTWVAVLAIAILLVLLLSKPDGIAPGRVPDLDKLRSSRWKADTEAGKTVLSEAPSFTRRLVFDESGRLLIIFDDTIPLLCLPRIEDGKTCRLEAGGIDLGLTLWEDDSEGNVLILYGEESRDAVYFIEAGQ